MSGPRTRRKRSQRPRRSESGRKAGLNFFVPTYNMDTDNLTKSTSRVTETTLARWENRRVELYIHSDDDDSLVRWAVGKLVHNKDAGYFVERPGGSETTLEPVEMGDFMRIAASYPGAPIRPVSYEPEHYTPPKRDSKRVQMFL